MKRPYLVLLGTLLFFISACQTLTQPSNLSDVEELEPESLTRYHTTSPLGTNLAGIADWSGDYPFINIFKASRPWLSGTASTWDDKRSVNVDAQGWVKSLQRGQIVRTVLLTDYQYPTGKYIVLYDGQGSLEYWKDAKKLGNESRPGRDVVEVTQTGGPFHLYITQTNPSNYIRNIRVIMPGGTCASNRYKLAQSVGDCPTGDYLSFEQHYQTLVFHPTFLTRLKNYSTIRFMDWMATNNSEQQKWSDHPQLSDARWREGVPVEVMVSLVNLLDIDPWFTLPHKADDDYLRRFAALVKEKLEPGRKVYIEYSNEVWNGQFAQYTYAAERGTALGLSTDRHRAALYYYSKRSQEMFGIWQQAFGGTSRLERVMAMQAANSWTAEQVLGYGNAATTTDALAIAPYFGDIPRDQKAVDTILRTPFNRYFDYIETTLLEQARDKISSNKAVADKFGVRLIAYEGGQHFTAGRGLENNTALSDRFDAVNRDPRMKDLYTKYLNIWKEEGGELFAHFTNSARWSKWGRYGALEYPTQPSRDAPKWVALQTFIRTTPKWW